MGKISQVLAEVSDLGGLAGWLNIRSNDIEAKCARQGACYRRELVSQHCDRQQSENPSKVAKDIAVALEKMGHIRQAQRLRELDFGKWTVALHSFERAGLP